MPGRRAPPGSLWACCAPSASCGSWVTQGRHAAGTASSPKQRPAWKQARGLEVPHSSLSWSAGAGWSLRTAGPVGSCELPGRWPGRVQRALLPRAAERRKALDPHTATGNAVHVRLVHQAQPRLNKPTVLRIEECSYRGALIGHGSNLPVLGVSVLTENSVAHLDVTGPVLRVDHNDASGPNQDVIKIRLWPAGPMDIVQGEPALGT
jgi:hypothetical protein